MDLAIVFLARVADVCLGTLRNIFASRGLRWQAAAAGFFEVVIFIAVLRTVLDSLGDPVRLALYGLGYAGGIVAGVWIEERLALGLRMLYVVAPRDARLPELLRAAGHAVTATPADGRDGAREVLTMVLKRRDAAAAENRIRGLCPGALVLSMEPRRVAGGFLGGQDGSVLRGLGS